MTLKSEHYCITPENLMVHELIGLKAKVVDSTDANKKGMKGVVVDETRNTLVFDCNGIEKVVPKKEVKLEFELGKEKKTIDGKEIVCKPEQRTKTLWGKKK